MSSDWAEALLESLEAFYGQRYDRSRWPAFLAVLRQQPSQLAQEAFNWLLRNWSSEKRLPPVAAVVQAFERVQEADAPSRDAQRSPRDLGGADERAVAALRAMDRLRPLFERPDL